MGAKVGKVLGIFFAGCNLFFFICFICAFLGLSLCFFKDLSYLCIRKAALGKLKASFLCARLHFLCQRIAILRPRPDLIKRKQMANNIENQDKSKPVANCDQYICKLIFFSFISSIFHLNIWILKRKIVSLRHHLK